MAANDFTKIVDFKPLEDVGLPREDAVKFMASLAPMIDLELQEKIKSAFTDEEMINIGREAEGKGIKPEDGMYFLEEKYYEKTGKYFMEETGDLFNQYVVRAAKMLVKAKEDARTFAGSESGDNMIKFNKLVEDGNWEEAAKLLDETLKNQTS